MGHVVVHQFRVPHRVSADVADTFGLSWWWRGVGRLLCRGLDFGQVRGAVNARVAAVQ